MCDVIYSYESYEKTLTAGRAYMWQRVGFFSRKKSFLGAKIRTHTHLKSCLHVGVFRMCHTSHMNESCHTCESVSYGLAMISRLLTTIGLFCSV